MEQLSLLQKIYLYGETLSSEELNQIVLYLNSSIEAINTLIARNNSINEGHCEMRYKVSAQLPEAPESGTDGKSNGWSDTYTKPDTANGEITWMTLSFFNGEGVYGAWSTPVCITWGSVRGLVGPKGESGLRGSFKSRVFKRLNTRPDTPTGGTYDNPIPSEGGWTDGIPSGSAIIWSSVCTFYGNGLSSGWTIPAPESDSDTLDIEFSPYAVQPEPPTGDTPFSNHESEGWYDSSSNNFNTVGTMVWRAERKVSNGEYNGDWTITRIVGEKGDKGDSGLTGGHYEFRYNNFKPSEQASAPTKPSNGSNGTTGGWTTSQETLTETLIKDGYSTWMTQCYQNEDSTYGTWTDPFRITGANGYDGADGIDIEFVYTKNNTGATPPTPPTTVTDDWPRHTDEHGNVVDHVTIGDYVWYDNPQGVEENMMYEFVSLRTKVDDVWSAYSPPVIWSKWGEKGMDGDGYEYIYKRFLWPVTWGDSNTNSDTTTHVQGKNDNPANWSTSASGYLNKEYYGPTIEGVNYAWSDDPVGIDENNKYEYVSTREYRLWPNETEKRWGAYSTPTLWSGIPGGKTEYRYAKDKSKPTKPDAGTSGTTNGWSASEVNITEAEFKEGYKAWMTQCFKTDTGTYGTWSDPIRISGANGLDGEDGSDIEFLYARTKTSTAPTKPSKPSSGDGSYTYDGVTRTWNDEDWGVGKSTSIAATDGDTTWSDNPRGVSNDIKYEWVIVRTKPAGKNTSFEDFSPVVIWSKYGEKGMDGDGVQYIFKLFDTELNSTERSSTYKPTKEGITLTNGEWIPSGWNDDPPTVSSEHPYCYCSIIKKTNGTWGDFETLSLWSNYAEAAAAVPGPPGAIGPMSYLAGIWNDTTTYTKTEKANPIVYYTDNNNNEGYYYLAEKGSSRGANPVTSNPNPWLQAENYNMVFTDILFVNDFAKLGSFIVNWDWMISQYGIIYDSSGTAHKIDSDSASWTNSGVTYVGKVSTSGLQPAYSLFDPYHPNTATKGATPGSTPNFVPYAAINAKTGESYFSNTHVTGEVTANSGTFNGIVNASGGVFNGIVNATLFKAGDDSGFSITTSPDSLDFNYNGNRLAFFSLRSWDSTNNQLADVPDNPTGFYLYLTNPLNGHLVTINFAELSFKDLNENQVLRHEATFYRLSNLKGIAVETPVTLHYSLENNTTKWWLHSDSTTELTSSEMGTLYKKQQVNQRGTSYGACVQEVDAGIPYVTTGYTLYELQTLQNNLPTKNGNYAMATYLNNDGSSSTDKWFVVPNSTTYLNNLNTNWSAVFRLRDDRVNETTATTVTQSSNRNTVPTFTFAVTFIDRIDENGNVVSILYPF